MMAEISLRLASPQSLVMLSLMLLCLRLVSWENKGRPSGIAALVLSLVTLVLMAVLGVRPSRQGLSVVSCCSCFEEGCGYRCWH